MGSLPKIGLSSQKTRDFCSYNKFCELLYLLNNIKDE